jgi:hypothetical protein
MHTIFFITELLYLMLSPLPASSIVLAARVSQLFNAVAIDVLWATLKSVAPLLIGFRRNSLVASV